MVGEIIKHVVRRIATSDSLATEEDVFVESGVADATRAICFVQYLTFRAIPVDLVDYSGGGFRDAAAVSVVEVCEPGCRDKVILGIV